MADEKELIRGRLDLVELVSERVKLSKHGKHWKGLCPFHAEKTPSFQVDQDAQLFHCFGCKKGGDIFRWIQLTENLDFRAALELLAERAGIELKKHAGTGTGKVEALRAVMDEALRFFMTELNKNSVAQEYVRTRGLSPEIVESWEIGYAPEHDSALATHLKNKGLKLVDAAEVSLLSGSQNSGFGDFFRGRLMFPIRDEQGRVIAFSGRSIDGKEPKYINSRDSHLFNKSETLFGLFKSKPALRENRTAILAEGQMDVIALHSAGLSSAVAALGTALTPGHAKKLARYCDEVVIIYDGDTAGRNATRRAFEIFAQTETRVRAVLLEPHQDPDTIYRALGASALKELCEQSVSPLQFTVHGMLRDFDAKPGIKNREFWDSFKSELARTDEDTEIDTIVNEVAPLHPNARVSLRNTVDALRAEIAALRKKKRVKGTPTAKHPSDVPRNTDHERPTPVETEVIRAAISDELRKEAWPLLTEEGLIVSEYGRVFADALATMSEAPPDDLKSELAAKLPENLQSMLFEIEAPPDNRFATPSPPLTAESFAAAVERLRENRAKRERRQAYEADPTLETAASIYSSSP